MTFISTETFNKAREKLAKASITSDLSSDNGQSRKRPNAAIYAAASSSGYQTEEAPTRPLKRTPIPIPPFPQMNENIMSFAGDEITSHEGIC